jgi:hypothetical protein
MNVVNGLSVSTRRDHIHSCLSSEDEEETQTPNGWKYYSIVIQFVFEPGQTSFVHYSSPPPGALSESNRAEARRWQNETPQFLAIDTKVFRAGAETITFRCQLSEGQRHRDFVLGEMIVKETRFVGPVTTCNLSNQGTLQAQSLAAYLADEFNRRLRSLPGFSARSTPKISFLDCSILILEDPDTEGVFRRVIAEKKLDTARYNWTKWNNNSGWARAAPPPPLRVDRDLATLMGAMDLGTAEHNAEVDSGDDPGDEGFWEVIAESEDDWSEDDWSDASELDFTAIVVPTEPTNMFHPSDYLQAFTHFTYGYTNHEVMVCDLQGVYNEEAVPPTFELTNPAIHCASRTSRETIYGRTDLGMRGMGLFFKTHECTDICKHVLHGSVNNSWRAHWSQYRGTILSPNILADEASP